MQVSGVLLALIGLATVFGGCDRSEEAAAVLEQTLREHASTKPKTGMLRALQVAKSAVEVTRRLAAPVDPACALELPEGRAFRYRWALELTRRSAPGIERRWKETRVLRRDAHGRLALEMQADFRTELGLEGRRTPQWRIVGEHAYISDDGDAFYRRRLQAGERDRVVTAGGAAVQTLLDAVSMGWSLQQPPSSDLDAAIYRVGGERLVCDASANSESVGAGAGWLRRFDTRATPLSGELRVGERNSRRVELRWKLEDGSTLEASFADVLIEGAKAVEVPDENQIVRVERDRSLYRIDRALSEMASAGIIDVNEVNDDNDERR